MSLGKRLWRDRYLYLLLLPIVIYFILFKYVPFYGIQMAFRDFDNHMNAGISASPWMGMYYFNRLFSSTVFFRVFKNTLLLNIMGLAFGFPAPIFLALMLNEVHSLLYKRVAQSIMYIPHFFSWVVLGGIVSGMLSPSTGIVNTIYKAITSCTFIIDTTFSSFRFSCCSFSIKPKTFRIKRNPILVFS